MDDSASGKAVDTTSSLCSAARVDVNTAAGSAEMGDKSGPAGAVQDSGALMSLQPSNPDRHVGATSEIGPATAEGLLKDQAAALTKNATTLTDLSSENRENITGIITDNESGMSPLPLETENENSRRSESEVVVVEGQPLASGPSDAQLICEEIRGEAAVSNTQGNEAHRDQCDSGSVSSAEGVTQKASSGDGLESRLPPVLQVDSGEPSPSTLNSQVMPSEPVSDNLLPETSDAQCESTENTPPHEADLTGVPTVRPVQGSSKDSSPTDMCGHTSQSEGLADSAELPITQPSSVQDFIRMLPSSDEDGLVDGNADSERECGASPEKSSFSPQAETSTGESEQLTEHELIPREVPVTVVKELASSSNTANGSDKSTRALESCAPFADSLTQHASDDTTVQARLPNESRAAVTSSLEERNSQLVRDEQSESLDGTKLSSTDKMSDVLLSTSQLPKVSSQEQLAHILEHSHDLKKTDESLGNPIKTANATDQAHNSTDQNRPNESISTIKENDASNIPHNPEKRSNASSENTANNTANSSQISKLKQEAKTQTLPEIHPKVETPPSLPPQPEVPQDLVSPVPRISTAMSEEPDKPHTTATVSVGTTESTASAELKTPSSSCGQNDSPDIQASADSGDPSDEQRSTAFSSAEPPADIASTQAHSTVSGLNQACSNAPTQAQMLFMYKSSGDVRHLYRKD